MLRCVTFCFLCICIGSVGFTQQDTVQSFQKVNSWGITGDYGFLIKHSESLRKMEDAYPFSVGIDWSKQLVTQKAWESCNCFPAVGINFSYWYWDNPEILGSGLVGMGYIEPRFRTHKPLNVLFKMGLGGTYLTKPYDVESNPNNLSYSLPFSFALMVGVGLSYRVNSLWNLKLLANYNHISNGGIQTPNKGLNYPTVGLALQRHMTPIGYPTLEKTGKRNPPTKKTRVTLYHLSGWSNANLGDRNLFYVFGLGAQYGRWVAARSALTVGTEFVADYSRKEQLKIRRNNDPFQQVALLLGHAFWLGKVTFSQELGVYYFSPYLETDAVYQRYGLTYTFEEKVMFGFNLKAHRHVADFFDFRIGWVF